MLAISIRFANKLYYHTFSDGVSITVSDSPEATIRIPKLEKKIQISRRDTALRIQISEGVAKEEISASLNEIVAVSDNPLLLLFVSPVCRNKEAFILPSDCDISVGRIDRSSNHTIKNDIVISLPFVSKSHFRLIRRNGETYVQDMGSVNGLFLNRQKVQKAKMTDGDVLSIFTVQITMKGDYLYFENIGDHLKLYKLREPDKRRIAKKDPGRETTRLFRRSPRMYQPIHDETISLEKPPKAGGEPQINWLSVLVTPLIFLGLMILLVAFMGTNATMLFMSGTMSVVSAIIAISNYKRQKATHGQKVERIDVKYHEYLGSIAARLEKEHAKQLRALQKTHPAPVECLRIARNLERQLWERAYADEDFISVRVGLGEIPASVVAKYQRNQVIIEEDPLENEAVEVAENSLKISGAPILCDLRKAGRVGVVGERTAEIQLVRNIIMELAAAHSYDEVKIVAVVPENELSQWEWMRWLPHCASNNRTERYIFTSLEAVKDFFDEVNEELNTRCAGEDDIYRTSADEELPHYIFVLAKRGIAENHPIKKHLYSNAPGCSSLFVYDQLHVLPKTCAEVISICNDCGEIYSTQNSTSKTVFQPDVSSVADADAFARALAPVYTETANAAASLPDKISFLEGYGVTHPSQLNIGKRWSCAQTYRSLSVPIAACAGGDPFFFDIHQDRHGVMGIVAGMPGSGKTEVVMSWLLSIAVNFSPQDVSFVLIDYKGTGLLAPFKRLPHYAGGISNLDVKTKTGETDPSLVDRNLTALRSERMRRLALLDKYKTEDAKYEINDLNRDYEKGKVPEKLPILLIVLDEYAEFKEQFPDFRKEIDSLLATGRALGMFVILATQSFNGIISQQSEDKIKFRWCMRVANSNASREMIGTSDAAKINVPGRAIVKIGEVVYEQVQSYWSGAPYYPDKHELESDYVPIARIAINGDRKNCEAVNQRSAGESSGTEIGAVVQHIAQYCTEHKIPSATKIWTEALPDRVSLFDLMDQGFDGQKWPETTATVPVVGLVDDPNNQRQYPMTLDFAKSGHTIIYGSPVTGKTTFLQTLIVSMAMSRKPDDVSIYAIDFGGWNLNFLENLPHVGGIANANEPERVTKLARLISETLEQRKLEFSAVGGNITAYRKATGKKIPDIILAVDNFMKDCDEYPELDNCYASVINTGANYGVYMVATANMNAVPSKYAQNVKNTIALQLKGNSDYSEIVGKVNQKLPDIEGRGFTRGNPPLVFQTAIPMLGGDDNIISAQVRKIAHAMCTCWTGDVPVPIPELPERIPYGSVKTNHICLGLSYEKVLPVTYQHNNQHYLLISGMEQSGKSDMLQLIARQFKEKLDGCVYAFDIRKTGCDGLKATSDAYFSNADQINEFLEQRLRPEIKNRYDMHQANPEVAFVPILIAIDDYPRFYRAVNNESIDRLETIIKIGGDLGIYLVVAGDAYEFSSLRNQEKVTIMLSNGKQSVMLGGCMADHLAVAVTATSSQKNLVVNNKEGYFIFKGEPCRFKAMESKGGVM